MRNEECVIMNYAFNLEKDTLYSYRYADFQAVTPADKDYAYSNWVRIGGQSAIGYTFGNYHVPDGLWGEAVTCDDLRFTYLWGTDFKAANGQSYTDEQIRYFIDASVAENRPVQFIVEQVYEFKIA